MPMNNFNFCNPTRIVFGKGQISQLPNYIPKDKTVIMTTGGGSIKRNGVYDQVVKALEGYTVKEFWGIEANPDFETLLKVLAIVKEVGADNCYLLSVGGGSVLDGTKLVAAAAYYTHSDDPWEILETYGAYITKAVPVVDIITLPATGSEMNDNSVVSWRNKHLKMAFASYYVFPVVSILDPETTYSLPTKQTANGVVDSIVHVCEQYATYPQGADINDRYAESILKVLIDDGAKVMTDPNNYQVRANIMWGATQALNKWIAQGVCEDWATHMIGHELTAYLGMDHGQTLACIQPRVFRYKFEQKKERLAQMAERVFNITEGTVEEKAEGAIKALEDFYANVMKVPTHISEYNVSQDKAWIQDVKEKFTKGGVKLGEHQDILPEDVEKIILASY
ncbi:hypothetical protein WA158_008513 [Blastocystis sp. Blastoise]